MKLSFSWLRLLLLLLLGTALLGQFGRVTLLSMPPIYAHEIVIGCLNLAVILSPVCSRTYWRIVVRPVSWWLFIAALIVSLLVNAYNLGSHVWPASLYLVRLLLYGSLVPIITSLKQDKSLSRFLPIYLPLIIAGLAVGGIGQYLFLPDTRFLYWLGWDRHLYRAIGAVFDPNFLGIIMVMGLFLTPVLPQKWHWSYLTLLTACLLLTYSRSSYLALLAGGISLLLGKHHSKAVLTALGAFIILLLILPDRGGEGNRLDRIYSVNNRFETQLSALALYRQHPGFGIGFNAYPQLLPGTYHYNFIPQRTSSPDNSFLLILATSGLIGFLTFLILLRSLARQFKDNPYESSLLTAVIVHAMFNNTLFYPYVMLGLSVLLGLKHFKVNT